MQRRDVLKQLSALAVLGGVGLPALAQPVGYELVAPPQPTEAKGKVEILEFFHYGCPHCKSFDPLLELWVKKLPSDVVFTRVPVTWGNPQLAGLAKLFLTLETTGDHARLHGPQAPRHRRQRGPRPHLPDVGHQRGQDQQRRRLRRRHGQRQQRHRQRRQTQAHHALDQPGQQKDGGGEQHQGKTEMGQGGLGTGLVDGAIVSSAASADNAQLAWPASGHA